MFMQMEHQCFFLAVLYSYFLDRFYYGSYKSPRENYMDIRNDNIYFDDGCSIHGLCSSMGDK